MKRRRRRHADPDGDGSDPAPEDDDHDDVDDDYDDEDYDDDEPADVEESVLPGWDDEVVRNVEGLVKDVPANRDYAFLTCPREPHEDVFFYFDRVVNPPRQIDRGMPVVFDVARRDDGSLFAESVTFIPLDEPRFEGDELWKEYARGGAESPLPERGGEVVRNVEGFVKDAPPTRDYAFIVCPDDPREDVFFYYDRVVNPPRRIVRGMPVFFDAVRRDDGSLAAESVTFVPLSEPRFDGDELWKEYEEVVPESPFPERGGEVARNVKGFVKDAPPKRDYAFIVCPEDPREDVFFYFDRVVNRPERIDRGMPVAFDVTRRDDGSLFASSVTFTPQP